MERKTKHRILGVLVVIGLIVIMLPLFQNGKELPSDVAIAKTPPFPDQSVQVAEAAPIKESAAVANTSPSAQTALNSVAETPIKQQPDDTINANSSNPTQLTNNIQAPDLTHPSPSSTASNETNQKIETNKPVETMDTKITLNDNKENETKLATTEEATPQLKEAITKNISQTPAVTKEHVIKTTHLKHKKTLPLHTAKIKSRSVTYMVKRTTPPTNRVTIASRTKAPLNNNGLINLKNSAWVIQVGDYKNKATALRIVNQLRANGYQAFIQQISNASGDNTRVFVGPENKQTAARSLATRLESELHIRGIVISYQPLTL